MTAELARLKIFFPKNDKLRISDLDINSDSPRGVDLLIRSENKRERLGKAKH